MQKITPESTLRETFDFYAGAESGVQVIPMTVKQQSDDTQLAILIKGEHQTASIIMAELMMKIQELFDLQQQVEATNADSNAEKSRIITG